MFSRVLQAPLEDLIYRYFQVAQEGCGVSILEDIQRHLDIILDNCL